MDIQPTFITSKFYDGTPRVVRFISLLTALTVLISCGSEGKGNSPTDGGNSGGGVTINDYVSQSVPDTRLSKCIGQFAALRNWKFVSEVTKLECIYKSDSYQAIESLAGIDGFTALRELHVYPMDSDVSEYRSVSRLKDTTPLKTLPNLQRLTLYWQELSTLTLPDNCQLTYLDVASSGFSNASEIKRCGNLMEIDITNNEVSTFALFSEMPNLRVLIANHVEAIDISALYGLRELNILSLSNQDYAPASVNYATVLSLDIQSLESLQFLDLSGRAVAGVNHLSNIPSLTHLRLVSSNFQSREVGAVRQLKWLDMGISIGEDLEYLSTLVNLEQLFMYRHENNDARRYEYSFLATLNNLTFLDIENAPYVDLRVLGNKENLVAIDIGGASIDSFRLLADISSLKCIYLGFHPVMSESQYLADRQYLETNRPDILLSPSDRCASFRPGL